MLQCNQILDDQHRQSDPGSVTEYKQILISYPFLFYFQSEWHPTFPHNISHAMFRPIHFSTTYLFEPSLHHTQSQLSKISKFIYITLDPLIQIINLGWSHTNSFCLLLKEIYINFLSFCLSGQLIQHINVPLLTTVIFHFPFPFHCLGYPLLNLEMYQIFRLTCLFGNIIQYVFDLLLSLQPSVVEVKEAKQHSFWDISEEINGKFVRSKQNMELG